MQKEVVKWVTSKRELLDLNSNLWSNWMEVLDLHRPQLGKITDFAHLTHFLCEETEA
jgi:hypothetical protein